MKVEVKLSSTTKEPYAVIYADEITDDIYKIINFLKTESKGIIAVKHNDKIKILNVDDIFIIKSTNNKIVVFTENKDFSSNKKLYDFENILGNDFFCISKSTIINLMKIKIVYPTFEGIMNVKMKNGSIETISRKYLSKFKKRIDL